MGIPFSGSFVTSASPEMVFDFLADPESFCPLLPDFQGMTREDSTHFTVKLNVGVGQLRGIAGIRMELQEARPSERVSYRGEGNALGSQITMNIGYAMSLAANSTTVNWRGEVSITGKLAMMANTMLEPLAGKGMTKLMEGLKNRLDYQWAQAQRNSNSAVIPTVSTDPETATSPSETPQAAPEPTQTQGHGSPDSPKS